MPVSEATYERVALEDPEGHWELVFGRLRSKPGMTLEHNEVMRILARLLSSQLDAGEYSVDAAATRLRISTGTYYVPDVCVIPRAVLLRRRQDMPRRLEVYSEPMPLVVEVWSPSTGEYDVETKLREYQCRGDLEIWRIHPYERTLTAWRRRPDGSYSETLYQGGAVQPVALPDVTIELERLFE
ncbi:MAG: Uma2 family endonuclease [Dehalococcoidia bacterium]